MTDRATLSRWFDAGLARGMTYMVVICDTFDHDDYPVYCTIDTVRVRATKPGNMQRAMEVYALHEDKAEQV